MITKALLQKICSTDETRQASIGSPYSFGKWTYATDGRIVVRVPRLETVPEHPCAPGAQSESIFESAFCEGIEAPEPIPTIPPHEMMPCACTEYTDEAGVEEGPYPDCEDCDGKGEWESSVRVPIGDRDFGSLILQKMSVLPNIKLYPKYGGAFAPMPFTFDGGQGLVMPMKKDKIDK